MGVKHSRHHHHNQHNHSQHHQDITEKKPNFKQSQSSYSTNSYTDVTIDGRRYHSDQASTYALPRDEIEQDRLNSQHFSLKALYDGNILKTADKLLPTNAKVLDLGCGSGSWVMEMAIDYPGFNIIGVDMADMFPTTIRPENVKFELYNILNGLPYPDNSFDFIHMRLLIIALRSNEWPLVIKEIYRVLKPGGLVQLAESDFTDKTNLDIVDNFNAQFINAMVEQGQDPYIGPKLQELVTQNNFNLIEVNEKSLSYSLPLNPIARESLTNWKNAMHSLKPLLAHRFDQSYDTLVDSYIYGITEAGWKVKMWAICAQKPVY